jgi:hypothetical protein
MSMQEVSTLSPARKAWITRRARAAACTADVTTLPTIAAPRHDNRTTAALAAFEDAARADMPDWHGAALALKAALVASPPQAITIPRPRAAARPKALPAPDWPDYDVNHFGSFHVRSDMLVVTFADGEIVRAPAVSGKGRPTNIGRGLRTAITFWQARAAWRRKLEYRDGPRFPIPEIVSCICEDTGKVYDAGECTRRTVEDRRGQLRLAAGTSKVRRYLLAKEFEGGQS